MTLDQFWNLVEKVHRASGGDMKMKCELLDAELRRLSLGEVRSFHSHFAACLDRAYSWALWGAAYVMGGGCSDDGFWDFRSTLISFGRDVFERALADPESLAELNLEDGIDLQWEGYQYVPSKVEADLSGGEDFPRFQPHPEEPSGEPWQEKQVAALYPKLAKKYAFAG